MGVREFDLCTVKGEIDSLTRLGYASEQHQVDCLGRRSQHLQIALVVRHRRQHVTLRRKRFDRFQMPQRDLGRQHRGTADTAQRVPDRAEDGHVQDLCNAQQTRARLDERRHLGHLGVVNRQRQQCAELVTEVNCL